MEQHLGHRTYYENLRAHLDESRFAPIWVPVDYVVGSRLNKAPLPRSVKPTLAARSQVRSALRSDLAAAFVFNTQVPAVLGGRLTRSRPYVVITDVTPKQYDRIAEGYRHKADRSGPLRWIKYRLNRRMFLEADWCVGWSNWVSRSFVEDYDVPIGRTRVIPPGVDTELWRPGGVRADRKLRLLFVGGDFERKGGEALLRAFGETPDDVELTIVTRTELPRQDRVTVLNDLSPNDPRLVELFRTSDVFVMPSVAETFGIAAVEAAAVGLPVVASDVGGLADIVDDGRTGYLIQPGDLYGLASVLRRLHDDPSTRRRMSVAGRRRAVECFDARTNAGRLLELLDEAVLSPL
jgi:glycosyltransferase involved in cell wall biosynthesis